MVSFYIVFVSAQVAIKKYKLKWSGAPTCSKINNTCYALASAVFCIYACNVVINDVMSPLILGDKTELAIRPVLPVILSALACPLNSESLQQLRLIYFYSKFWEAIDIILVSLSNPEYLHIHFVVHHNSTPIIGMVAYLFWTPSSIVFMLLNTFQHFWVYSYFAGLRNNLFFAMTRLFGHLQLVLPIAVSVYSLWDFFAASGSTTCDAIFDSGRLRIISRVLEVVPLMLYAVYLWLLRVEIQDYNKATARTNAIATKNESDSKSKSKKE